MKNLNKIILLITCIAFVNGVNAQVSGTVYRDHNGNSVTRTAVPNLKSGVSGIIVNAYNASDTIDAIVALYTTTATGTHSELLSISTFNGMVGANSGPVNIELTVCLQ